MADQKNAEQTADTAPPDTVTREEFVKVSQLADALGANLRKEREASAKRITGLEEQLRSVAETLSAIKGPPPADGDKKPDEMQARYEARLKEMEAKFDAERKARETEQKARVEQERRTALSNALVARGITGAHLKAAMATIYDAQGLVVHDDNGAVGLKFARSGYDDIVPIEQGLDELLKNPDFQIFVPSRPAAGSGTVPGNAPRNGSGKPTKEDMIRALPALILKATS